MKPTRLFVLALALTLVFSSCAIIKTHKYKNSEQVILTHRQYGDMEVVFFNMIHASTPAIYQSVGIAVDSLKRDGFTVFYEKVKKDSANYSAAAYDTL